MKKQLLELKVDLKNPKPDRRVTRDWAKGATFPTGLYLLTTEDHSLGKHEFSVNVITKIDAHGKVSMRRISEVSDEKQFNVLKDALQPVEPDPQSLRHLIALNEYAYYDNTFDILEWLLAKGVIDANQIEKAVTELDKQWEEEEDQQWEEIENG